MERSHESSQAMHVRNIGGENSELEKVGFSYPLEAMMLRPDDIIVPAF